MREWGTPLSAIECKANGCPVDSLTMEGAGRGYETPLLLLSILPITPVSFWFSESKEQSHYRLKKSCSYHLIGMDPVRDLEVERNIL